MRNFELQTMRTFEKGSEPVQGKVRSGISVDAVPAADQSNACPECGVVPSRFIDGDHDAGCSRQTICPECGSDPTTMFHGITGCTLATKYEPRTVRAILRHLRLDNASTAEQEIGLRDWLGNHPPAPLTVYSLRDCGRGHLLG